MQTEQAIKNRHDEFLAKYEQLKKKFENKKIYNDENFVDICFNLKQSEAVILTLQWVLGILPENMEEIICESITL